MCSELVDGSEYEFDTAGLWHINVAQSLIHCPPGTYWYVLLAGCCRWLVDDVTILILLPQMCATVVVAGLCWTSRVSLIGRVHRPTSCSNGSGWREIEEVDADSLTGWCLYEPRLSSSATVKRLVGMRWGHWTRPGDVKWMCWNGHDTWSILLDN